MKKLSSIIEEYVNKQIEAELIASNLYIMLSNWTEKEKMIGCTNFLIKHAKEELDHMQYAIDYLIECNMVVNIPIVKERKALDISNILDLFQQALLHEKLVSSIVNQFVVVAKREKDEQTLKFLEWFIDEQEQEEDLFKMIVSDIEDIGLNNLNTIESMISSMR